MIHLYFSVELNDSQENVTLNEESSLPSRFQVADIDEQTHLNADTECDCHCPEHKPSSGEPVHFNYFETILNNDDNKLNAMTGIPTFALLEKIVKAIEFVQPTDNCLMSIKIGFYSQCFV